MAEHPEDCTLAWTVRLSHDGRVEFEPCPSMSVTQKAVAERLLDFITSAARVESMRDAKRALHSIQPPKGT